MIRSRRSASLVSTALAVLLLSAPILAQPSRSSAAPRQSSPAATQEAFRKQIEATLAELRRRPAAQAGRARQVAAAVLSRREFRQAMGQTLYDRIMRWLGGLVQRVFGALPAGWEEFMKFGVLGVITAGGLIALYLLVRQFYGRGIRRRPAVPDEIGEYIRRRTPEELLAEADAAAASGRLLHALRLAYGAALQFLDRGGALAFDPARTNWEVLVALRRSGPPEAHLLMRQASLLVEDKFYGGRPVAREHYDTCRSLATDLEKLLCA